MKKKGVFFSIDAFIALVIIFLILLIAIPVIINEKQNTEIHYDIITVFSNLKTGEINGLPAELITDPNKTVINQIGEFYAAGDNTKAKQLADFVIQDLDTNENLGIWYDNTLITSKNSSSYESARLINTARQTISGITNGSSVTGFSARAFLSSNQLTKYIYFGGYLGDGNLTVSEDIPGSIDSLKMELVINQDFDFIINNNSLGIFQGSADEFTPVSYTINDPANLSYFSSGTNIIEFKGSNLHIAGGFIRINYDANESFQQSTRYNFPGIHGLINLYDGFYVPGQLNSLDIYLHLNSSQTTFLNIGNTTVYSNTTNDEETISISDAQLSSILDYNEISSTTIPLRLGLENVSYTSNGTALQADTFSVTDISGSMNDVASVPPGSNCSYEYCTGFFNCGNQISCPYTTSCSNDECSSGGWLFYNHQVEGALTKLDLAKEANKVFTDVVLNNSGNRVGLIGYEDDASDQDYHNLSENNQSLNNKIDSWTAGGGTCICCGINRAASDLAMNSSNESFRSMVVMSDGQANVECPQQNTGDASQDAIQASCDAFNNHEIRVYAVGFGNDVDESTLQSVAACGNGSYYFADVDELASVYQQIAQDLIQASFVEQTIQIEGNLITKLYSDSYIEFNYTSIAYPFGLIITTEKQFSNATTGTFDIPSNVSIIEAVATSYSGPRWTNTLTINQNTVYNLPDYGSNYISLGDPYRINIPSSQVNDSNTVTLTTGVSPQNNSEGSAFNKIIYTIAKEGIAFSPVLGFADGCTWSIQFEDDSNTTTTIPSSYNGSDQCYYDASHPGGQIANTNDAYQQSVLDLLRELDLNQNNKVDIIFTEEGLQIDLSEIQGIPYAWSTEVQARAWR